MVSASGLTRRSISDSTEEKPSVAPCSWNARAMPHAIEWSFATPKISAFLPSSSPIATSGWEDSRRLLRDRAARGGREDSGPMLDEREVAAVLPNVERRPRGRLDLEVDVGVADPRILVAVANSDRDLDIRQAEAPRQVDLDELPDGRLDALNVRVADVGMERRHPSRVLEEPSVAFGLSEFIVQLLGMLDLVPGGVAEVVGRELDAGREIPTDQLEFGPFLRGPRLLDPRSLFPAPVSKGAADDRDTCEPVRDQRGACARVGPSGRDPDDGEPRDAERVHQFR